MIKCINVHALLIFSCCCFVAGQTRIEIPFTPADTISRHQGIIPPVEFRYDLNNVFKVPFGKRGYEDLFFDDNPSTIWLKTKLLLSNYQLSPDKKKFETHFTSPLYRQYLKDSEFNMVRYVLGMAQASAVAYMAYRHIRKYGFWK